MARDAGFSALFLSSLVFAIFLPIRVFVRERESGTMAMALAHATSRGGFFSAKLVGLYLTLLKISLVIFGTMLVMVEGAKIGGELAKGDIARIYGPCAIIGFVILLLPLIIGAILNRFIGARFVLSAHRLMVILAVVALVGVGVMDGKIMLRYFPVALLVIMPASVVMALASALAAKFKPNLASSLAVIFIALSVPFVGTYYPVNALSYGGVVAWGVVVKAFTAILPFIVAFLCLGILFTGENDGSN